MPEEDFPVLKNFVAALLKLERSQHPEAMLPVIRELLGRLSRPEQANLKRAFTVWCDRVLLRPEKINQAIPAFEELEEVETMLAERVREWTMEWKLSGLKQGRLEGRQEGESKVLIRLLVKKFGTISAEDKARITGATEQEILHWVDRVWDAKALQDVFK